MSDRSRSKVKDSHAAVALLHQEAFLDPAFHVTRKVTSRSSFDFSRLDTGQILMWTPDIFPGARRRGGPAEGTGTKGKGGGCMGCGR
jgi:hypothetical protein